MTPPATPMAGRLVSGAAAHGSGSDSDDPRSIVRREVLRFAIPGLIGLVILALLSLVVAVAVAREQSMRDAAMTAQFLARSVVEPRLSEDLIAGRPGDISSLDDALAVTLEGSDVLGLRVWTADGIVVYADDPRIIGEPFVPAPTFDPGAGVVVEPADVSRPENRYLDPESAILDVSVPVKGADGVTYLVQVHQLQDSLSEDARRIWLAFAPVVLGSLLLLAVVLGLLAVRMARRISADLRVRQDLLQRAVDAGDVERRRIAARLHDGTVQDLAGLSFTLAGLSARARADGAADDAEQLDSAAGQARDAVRGLRSLLVDIYPANLTRTGLAPALADQIAALPSGIEARADVAEIADLDPEVQAVVYRIAREALANAAKHSGADHVTVTLLRERNSGLPEGEGGRERAGERAGDRAGERAGEEVVLTVTDDGTGFDPDAVETGHMGLRISSDLAESVGGRLTVAGGPGTGTTVTVRVPVT